MIPIRHECNSNYACSRSPETRHTNFTRGKIIDEHHRRTNTSERIFPRRVSDRASLLSLQREFLTDVWGYPLPALSSWTLSRLSPTPSFPLTYSSSLFLSFSFPPSLSLSLPRHFTGSLHLLPVHSLSSLGPSFPRCARQAPPRIPTTGTPLRVYISRVLIRDWAFFVLVAKESSVSADKRGKRAEKCHSGWCARRDTKDPCSIKSREDAVKRRERQRDVLVPSER